MRKNWIGALIVFGIAFAIVGAKAGCTTPAAVAQAPAAAAPRVVLVADLSEAETTCGCGEIIRAVRATAARGVPTVEIDPKKNRDDARKYGTLITPTVIVMNDAGKEARRYEGESSDTIKKLKEDLARLPGKT